MGYQQFSQLLMGSDTTLQLQHQCPHCPGSTVAIQVHTVYLIQIKEGKTFQDLPDPSKYPVACKRA